jgi:hypothetical protein
MGARWRKANVTIALIVLASLAACRPRKASETTEEESETAFVEDGTDTSAAESDAQLLTSSLVASSSTGEIGLASLELSGSDIGPRDVGEGAKALYLPSGCLDVVHDEAAKDVTYTFHRCLGPNGLRAVSGVVKAHYAIEPNHLHLDLTADELAINEATVDWAATADIVSTGADRAMTWKARLSGTTAGGRSFSRNAEHTISWRVGEACFSFSGFSQGEVTNRSGATGREIRTEISDYRRCRRGCPDAGGKITVTNVARSQRIELLYDGTNRATFVTPDGSKVIVPLLCRP